jgi:hypothetical protein
VRSLWSRICQVSALVLSRSKISATSREIAALHSRNDRPVQSGTSRSCLLRVASAGVPSPAPAYRLPPTAYSECGASESLTDR